MSQTIEYYFSVGSPWAYLGLDTLEELSKRHLVGIKPYLATIIEENGGIFGRNKPEVRRAYINRELRRWSNFRGIPVQVDDRPALGDPTPASFSVIAAYLDGENWLQLARTLQRAYWADARDIGQVEVRKAVADEAGFDGARLIAREQDADVQEKWRHDREQAVRKGVFGFPTYIYEDEVYWGQDNLGFLASHLRGERP